MFFSKPTVVVAFLVVLAVSVSNAFENGGSSRSLMGDNISNLLEKLRDRMHMDMTETMGIPRLDPFTTDSLNLDSNLFGDIGLGEYSINLTNVRAVGLKKFVLDDADLQLAGLVFNMQLSVPTAIAITGNYESDGHVAGMLSIKGSGPFSVNITGLHFGMVGQIQFAANIWTIRELSVDFGIEKLSVEFIGLEKMGDLFNEMLSEIGPEMLDILWPDIEPIVVQQAKVMAEESLVGVTLFDMLAILSGTKEIFPPITDS